MHIPGTSVPVEPDNLAAHSLGPWRVYCSLPRLQHQLHQILRRPPTLAPTLKRDVVVLNRDLDALVY